MKLRNKKTGEIIDLDIANIKAQFGGISVIPEPAVLSSPEYVYTSLAELNKEWEDVPEEPKEHWAIDQFGEPINVSGLSRLQLEKLHRLGNDFPSENATLKAIEKLKAWKRLRKNHFKFDEYDILNQTATWLVSREYDEYSSDIDLLFSQEDE